MDVETHQAVFQWVLQVLAEKKLLKGNTIGVDATTLEANAALRSIVRRDTGERYEEFLTRLAKESGIETPTREQLAKLDRKPRKKGSNDDWTHPHDPDAITKMKDGRTHLAHKADHAVTTSRGHNALTCWTTSSLTARTHQRGRRQGLRHAGLREDAARDGDSAARGPESQALRRQRGGPEELRGFRAPRPFLKLGAILFTHHNWFGWSTHASITSGSQLFMRTSDSGH